MDPTMLTYARGSIVRYVPATVPTDETGKNYNGMPGPHPMLILDGNAGESASSCQCMLLSSKLNSYFGYRIYLNTMDRTYQGFSVICCTKMFTIEKRYLYDILGFAPAHLVNKCAMAYAWIIGLTDEIPEFYQQDEISMQYACGTSPNIPKCPTTRSGINPGAPLEKIACYSSKPRGNLARDIWKLKNRDAPELIEGQVVEFDPADVEETIEAQEASVEGMNVVESTPKDVYTIGCNLVMLDTTDDYDGKKISKSAAVLQLYDSLTDMERFQLYTRLRTARDVLMGVHKASSSTAYRTFNYLMQQVIDERRKFVDGVNSGAISIDKIILEKKYHFIWHCLTVKDLDMMKLNVARYIGITKGIDEQYANKG